MTRTKTKTIKSKINYSLSNSFKYYLENRNDKLSIKAFSQNMIKLKDDKYTDIQIKDKVHLTDNFGRFHNYLRISLTERCNLRCTYCMPEQGVELTKKEDLMTKDELFKIISIFISCGVDKIRLTGGEPTVNKDCTDIIREINKYKSMKSIAMTTNGLTLKSHLTGFKDAGLTHINISLDTMIEAKFNFISRRQGLSRIIENIDRALTCNFQRVKVNCVLMKGVNDDEVFDFVEFIKERDIDVRFIEFMPFVDNKWSKNKMISFNELFASISSRYKLEKMISIDDNQPSSDYIIKGYKGKIGFISSMTNKFCSSCNRIRLTADGNLKVCLFGREETNLVKLLREGHSDDYIINIISNAIKRKKASHDGMFEISKDLKNRPMIKIGG